MIQTLSKFGGHITISRYVTINGLGQTQRTTRNIEPSLQLLAEERFTFQKSIVTVVYNQDIQGDLIINLDQTPLFCVYPVKYTFNFKGGKNVSINGGDDKRQSYICR